MNRGDQQDIPENLRDRLAEEPSDEREELEQVWYMLGSVVLSDDESPSAHDTWQAVRARIGPKPAEVRPARKHQRRRTWAVVAAGVVLLVVAGALFWRQPMTVEALAGERTVATLPDGSTVELNSGTKLSYAPRFNIWPFVPADRRVVQLQGEAFFNVQSADRPFVVETFNARIEVLGTQFNVRARADRDTGKTRVTLAEGRIRVRASAQPGEVVTLTKPGQESSVQATATPTPPHAVGIDRTLAWRQQGFAVSDWPLTAIFDELERRYDVPITVRARMALADSMTLYYPQHTEVETIIRDIAVSKGLTYRRTTSQGYEITARQ